MTREGSGNHSVYIYILLVTAIVTRDLHMHDLAKTLHVTHVMLHVTHVMLHVTHVMLHVTHTRVT